ncbi:unnamed protein product [Calicophoron daubneyi]|uniref:Noggin n=1 Tax=Calicophoron daubneyi TaxID=300641 RepID=A0AAV2T3H3_CALDB
MNLNPLGIASHKTMFMQWCLTAIVIILLVGMRNTDSASFPRGRLAMITTGNGHNAHGTQSDADYSRKMGVRVSDILTRQREAAAEASSYRFKLPNNQDNPITRMSSSQLKEGAKSNTRSAQIVVRPPNYPPSNALVVPMANSRTVIDEDHSWPPENSQEFERVDVRVLGEKIDNKALLQLRPSSSTASVRKLRKILGPDLELEWMSVEPPVETKKGGRSIPSLLLAEPETRLIGAVENLNFTVLRKMKDSDIVIPVELTVDQVGIMKDWLLQLASCKVDYVWEDLGPLFWPRWIRRGICTNTFSCSWPPGMRCRPSGSKSLKLLRWICTNDTVRVKRARASEDREYKNGFRDRLRRDQHQLLGRKRVTREERRSRRVKRLIRKLSLTANGYHCEWSKYEHMVNDHCTCGCE